MNEYRYRSDVSLRGSKVVNTQGEDLGQIRDLVFDLDTGGIAYAVLSSGGFLSAGDKLFAVPWEAFKVQHDSDHLVLDVPVERLQNAPGFEHDNWPTHADYSFLDSVYSHYGYKRYEQHRDERYGDYLERRRKAREGTMMDVIDPKRDGIS